MGILFNLTTVPASVMVLAYTTEDVMKVKVTMVLDIEADSLEEAREVYHELNDYEFLEMVADADVTVEEV